MTKKSRLLAISLPLFAGLLPILSLFAKNPGEVWLSDFCVLFALMGSLTLFVFSIFVIFKKNFLRASFASFLVFLPLSIVNESHSFYLNVSIWMLGITLAICFLFIPFKKTLMQKAQQGIFISLLALTSIYTLSIVTSKNRIRQTNHSLQKQLDSEFALLKETQIQSEKPLRDIYFIILDEYISQTTFRNYYQYDNESFFLFLESSGFHLVKHPYSNYPWTIPSISSMVSLGYHKNWVEKKEFPQVAHFLLRYNLAAKLLESEGYKTYSTPSVYWFGNPSRGIWSDFFFRAKSYGLTMSILRSTPFTKKARGLQRKEHRKHIQYQLAELQNIVKNKKERKFVFTHFLCPHRPIVFDKNGEPLRGKDVPLAEKDKEHTYYLNQAHYISQSIQEMVQTILKSSDNPPLIVLVSDHGKFPIGTSGKGKVTLPLNDLSWRLSNFIALYLPDKETEIPKLLTPVNIFRMILSDFHGYDLPSIENVCHTHFFDLEEGLYSEELVPFQYGNIR